jgi:tRNA(fMet)-specific endonuclease VapC
MCPSRAFESAGMGLILDSSVLIAAERKGSNARQVLSEIAGQATREDVALSVVTLIELAHGAARAQTPERRAMRQQFMQELTTALPVHPVTVPIALRAGQIDGESAAKSVRIALSDLLIGVTALELGYRVATANVRHFQAVPGLEVVFF